MKLCYGEAIGVDVRDFTFAIYDERYTAPTLLLVSVTDEKRACEMAKERLERSPFHLAVEVREGDRLIGRFDRDAGL